MLTDRIDAEFLRAVEPLRAVANYAVGTDNVDLVACTAAGIPVGNTPDVLTDATADLAFALLLAAARRLREAEEAVRSGNWPPWSPRAFLGHDVAGATLGIVGFGRVGRAVARRGGGVRAGGPPHPPPRRGLRHGRPAQLALRRDAAGRAAPALRLREPPRAADGGDARADRRARARADETDGDPGEHRARRAGPDARARARAAQRADRG